MTDCKYNDRWAECVGVELRVTKALLGAYKGTNKVFVSTFGTIVLPETDSPVDESTPIPVSPNDPLLDRYPAEVDLVKVTNLATFCSLKLVCSSMSIL